MRVPIASLFASSQMARDLPHAGQSGQISATNQSGSRRPSRVSARQFEALAERMSDHDRAVLELVGRLRLCSGAQLVRALWPDGSEATRERRARHALSRLTDWRVLDRLPRYIGGIRAGSRGFLYCVGPAGARLLARDGARARRLVAPGDRYIAHTLAITELVVELMEAEHAGRLDVLGIETEPTCWRPFTGPMGARLVVKPDLFVRIGVGSFEDRWFVEVDRATESPATLTRKARTYLAHYRSGSEQSAHGIYPRVLWSVPDERRAAVVHNVLAALPPEAGRLFTVSVHADVVALMAEEAAS